MSNITQTEIEILESFFPTLGEKTAKEVEQQSKVSHETAFRTLKALVEKKFLKKRNVGKTNVYEFMKERDNTRAIFIPEKLKKLHEFKQKNSLLYKRLYEFIDELKPEDAAIFILFGSFAKGTNTKESDIDLLCRTHKKNVLDIARVFKTKYAMNIHPVVMKPADFKDIQKENPSFWNDLLSYGIVLEGFELLFKEAYTYE